MVLPARIELAASPLPRECSTTELRQHGLRSQRRTIQNLFWGMVLPARIELAASPLPRECSTTELRQHFR